MRVGECRRGRGCRRRCTGRRAMAYRDQVVGDDAGTDREYRSEHRQQRLEEGHCRDDSAAEPVHAHRPGGEHMHVATKGEGYDYAETEGEHQPKHTPTPTP